MKKAVAMKCSQKDWDSIKDRFIGINLSSFNRYDYIVNNFSGKDMCIKNIFDFYKNDYNREIHETFNAKIFLNACGIDCDVYEITKEQVLKLHNNEGSRYVKEWFPEAFKKELEVGKWYSSDSFLIMYKGNERCISISKMTGDYDDNNIHRMDMHIDCDYKEATTQEVEAALICEAKKRGFKDGVLFKSVEKNIDGIDIIKFGSISSDIFYGKNKLFNSRGYIFKDGIWAQIIDKTLTEPKLSLNDLLSVWGDSSEIEFYKQSPLFQSFLKLAKSK